MPKKLGEDGDGNVTLADEMSEFDVSTGDEVESDESDESDGNDDEEDENAEADSEDEDEEGDTDAETEEADEGSEEVDELEAADEEKDEEEEDTLSTDAKTIAQLRKQLSDNAATQQPAQVIETQDEIEQAEIKDFEFATDDNFDDILRDPESFNKVLNAGIKQALETANVITQQNAMQAMQVSLPQMVHTQVEAARTVNEAVTGFYAEHPTLNEYRGLVAQNINAVQAESPELTLTDVMKKAAKKSYQTLGLAETVRKAEKSDKIKKKAKNTGLRKGKGTKRSKFKTEKSALQAEMDELT